MYIILLCIVNYTGIRKVKAGRDEKLVQEALKKLSASAAASAADGNSNKVGTCTQTIYPFL